jgi:hypothetical protein
MPKSDLEVFERLTQDADTATEIDFIAYAMFAFEKKEWIEHHVKISGHPPTQEQIDSWISNITDFQFQNMREKAIDFFDDSARNYLEEEIAQAKHNTVHLMIRIAFLMLAGGRGLSVRRRRGKLLIFRLTPRLLRR